MDKKELKPEVAARYQVLEGHGVGEYNFKGHVVHLDRLTPDAADKLVKDGFGYLVAKPEPAKPVKTP